MKRRFFGAVLILSGTCIGAGMLALPVSTAPLGFFFSLLLLVLTWAYMAYTGYLVIEANLWFPDRNNYISMARATLGKAGAVLCWVSFLLLLYSLMAAYITGGGALVVSAMKMHGIKVTAWQSYLPWVIVFGIIIYLGTRFTDWINRILMLGLIIAYALLATEVSPHLKPALLTEHAHFSYWLAALPILLTSFGYHIVLPSMRHYLHGDKKKLWWMVLWGSMLPLLVYALWELIIFGVVPLAGKHGLLAIWHSGQPTSLLTNALVDLSQNVWLSRAARFFAFFAIASSFVGVSLGLFDILADGLKVKRNHLGKTFVSLLTFIPPLIFALVYPHGFIVALGYAGIFVAVLHGILPAAMVWSGRYHLKIAKGYRVFGGWPLLVIVILIACLVIYAECVT